ncbi:MAG: DUF445 domain-containing protein [Microthrixaceae bacterium]
MPIDGDERERRRALRRMKGTAVGLLVFATAVFIACAAAGEGAPGWVGYVRAAAEAGMVGGLADWFAVTALFKHPLGIPIPHTAIIQKRKDDIGRGLGAFVSDYFLTAEAIGERLSEAQVASRLGSWMAEPEHAQRLAGQVLGVSASVLDAVRDDEVRDAIEEAVTRRLRTTSTGPLAGRVLELAIAEGRHRDLASVILARLRELLEANRGTLRTRMATESPWWVPDPVDDAVFERLFVAADSFLGDLAADPDHELRRSIDVRVEQLATDLAHDPATGARADELRDELLDHPQLREWTNSVWADLKERIKAAAADPDHATLARLASTIAQFGRRLAEDPALSAKVDEWAASVVGEVAEQSRTEVGAYIATTVQRWDTAEAADRIELQVGRDLQFVRINGTVVGSLAGLVIYSIGQLLG